MNLILKQFPRDQNDFRMCLRTLDQRMDQVHKIEHMFTIKMILKKSRVSRGYIKDVILRMMPPIPIRAKGSSHILKD